MSSESPATTSHDGCIRAPLGRRGCADFNDSDVRAVRLAAGSVAVCDGPRASTPLLVGLAVGAYGLTQAGFQVPLGRYRTASAGFRSS